MTKPKKNLDGFYYLICQNPNCPRYGKPFPTKNWRALTCCESCRNEKNYLLRKELFNLALIHNQGYLLNTKILMTLLRKGNTEVVEDVLNVLGFRFDITPSPVHAADGVGLVYIYGEYCIQQIINRKFKIWKKNGLQ